MDPSGLGLGGVKAGAPVDPLAFIKRPSVVIRICSLVGEFCKLRGGEGWGVVMWLRDSPWSSQVVRHVHWKFSHGQWLAKLQLFRYKSYLTSCFFVVTSNVFVTF
jgi:hypothetical protein